ncbi:MAG: HAMP domain-containing sensor histidine kinase [Polyangiaceae bacterium]|jgi:signal transduction histidine kinase
MEPIAMTLIAAASEPSPLEARAHAIKNCVSVILGLASTIERHVDPFARPRVTQLVDTSHQLKELLARPAKSCAWIREDVSVADVVKLVTDRLEPQAEACDVRLAIACAGGVIRGDFGDLAEALYNVCSNALYASPAGTTVRISTRRSADGDHEWSVEDAGCGIPPSMMPRLGGVGVTTRDGGTGLGLSLALQAVTRHDGVMRIESVEGGGTTVIIWLPAKMEASKRT